MKKHIQFNWNFFEQRPLQVTINAISPAETSNIKDRWRLKFSEKLKKEEGVWIKGGYDWHVFTYEFCKNSMGSPALADYLKIKKQRFYMFSHESRFGAGEFSGLPPDPNIIYTAMRTFHQLVDIYVSSVDMSWTMVFTHEDSGGCGPFFSPPAIPVKPIMSRNLR